MSRLTYPLLLLYLLSATPGALLALPAAHAAGSDDDYLRAIQAEGNKLETLNRAREELRQGDQPEQPAVAQRTAKPVDTATFEEALNREAPATYKLYAGLPAEKRKIVYDLYLREGKIASAKRKIVELHLGN